MMEPGIVFVPPGEWRPDNWPEIKARARAEMSEEKNLEKVYERGATDIQTAIEEASNEG